jgi:hypothetical protein
LNKGETGTWCYACSKQCSGYYYNASTAGFQDGQPAGAEQLSDFLNAKPLPPKVKTIFSSAPASSSLSSSSSSSSSSLGSPTGTGGKPYRKESNLVNSNVTMCYLDACIQLLCTIPEIPAYFKNNNDSNIDNLKIKNYQERTVCVARNLGEYIYNIKLLKSIFDEISLDRKTTIIKIKNPLNKPQIKPNVPNNDAEYYNNHYSYWDLTSSLQPLTLESFLNIGQNGKPTSYRQADPDEFLANIFFNNFICTDNNFADIVCVKINETRTCKQPVKKREIKEIQSVIQLPLINSANQSLGNTINDLLTKYQTSEDLETPDDECGDDAAKGNQALNDQLLALKSNRATEEKINQFKLNNNLAGPSSKQSIIELLDKSKAKYIIINLKRKFMHKNGNQFRVPNKIEISKNIAIEGVRFIRKGCIFHSGDGSGGHYVYGVYDQNGHPDYIIDDLNSANASNVFSQNGWVSTMCLYERDIHSGSNPGGGGKRQRKSRRNMNKSKKSKKTRRSKKN